MIEDSFNVIHTGHLQFFTEAKKRCDVLVVLVERPQSIRQSKGYGNVDGKKPLIGLGDKLRTLKNFQEYSVNWLDFRYW
ncbi:hypothetical protein A3J43_01195 [Candidatus Uhrbacteria bacterium RIFCSPHIGHO2_12_FULL_54_23]|uniref:Cytidyltransferase-like domain-containing protein n=1 Tax=Candidatus Uhrbacteria bacterium RIFCSPHIGHO2_12_FULL_54_23 TaxID=1802397 RepID=A0A1F7UK21_9BACT|nr:MAG: hypothetical protein A3J43_01195 [Candidatus Uhrbacteria bacterium RIFCSPHIGHO2_12_FULL_54_23]